MVASPEVLRFSGCEKGGSERLYPIARKWFLTFLGVHLMTFAKPYCCASCASRRLSSVCCLEVGVTFSSPDNAGCAGGPERFICGMLRSAREHCKSTILFPGGVSAFVTDRILIEVTHPRRPVCHWNLVGRGRSSCV